VPQETPCGWWAAGLEKPLSHGADEGTTSQIGSNGTKMVLIDLNDHLNLLNFFLCTKSGGG
jgi:hypothetical protein